jgi:hypothetical protein
MDDKARAMQWKSVAADRCREMVGDGKRRLCEAADGLDEAADGLDEAAALLRSHAEKVG